MKYNSIALFCGSASGNNPIYALEAARFGTMLAQRNVTLYYGGGRIGLMGATADAVMAHGGSVIGIAPDFFNKDRILADNITEMILVRSMSERKQMMEQRADAFVVLPGGYGTMDELFELITDAQLGLHFKPVAIYNPNGYYDMLLKQLDRFSQDGFLRTFHKDLLLNATTLDELFYKLDHYENSNSKEWLERIKE